MINKFKSIIRDLLNFYFFKKIYFSNKPVATRKYYENIFIEAKSKIFKNLDSFENKKNFKIDKSWLDNLAFHTQIVKKKSTINYQHGRLLYSTLRRYIVEEKIKKINILEIGTARGFSAVCMSKAINDSNIIGKISTIDIIPHTKKIYWNCIDDINGKKTREELLNPWKKELKNISFFTGPSSLILKKIKIDKVDFAFIDGMHDYYNVKNELIFLKKRQTIGNIIVIDDYDQNKFEGVVKALTDQNLNKNYKIEILSSDPQRTYAIATRIK